MKASLTETETESDFEAELENWATEGLSHGKGSKDNFRPECLVDCGSGSGCGSSVYVYVSVCGTDWYESTKDRLHTNTYVTI